MEKDLMNFEHRWKLLDWIDESKFIPCNLSRNPNALYLLEKNPEMIDWNWISCNPSAIHLLLKNQDKINN